MDSNISGSTPPPPPPAAGGSGGGEIIYPQQPPKDPILILVLNLLVAGCVGYFMIGQKFKAIGGQRMRIPVVTDLAEKM